MALLIYLMLATGIAAVVSSLLHTPGDAAPPLAGVRAVHPAKYLVLIVLDGARPDYFDVTRLPHVDALRAGGAQFTNAFDGILESETPSGHTTIATGSPPARNGILGFDWAQSDTGRFSLFSPDVIRSGTLERIMAANHVPTIAGLFKARYPHARVIALSGHKYYAADPLGGPSADAIMYYQGNDHGQYVPVAVPGHMPPAGVLTAPGVIGPNTHLGTGGEDRLATRLAISAFKVMRPRVTLINYPEFDWPAGHVNGGMLDRPKIVALMKNFDRDVAQIEAAYARAGVLRQTLFVITADHGMMPIHRFVPQAVVRDAVSAAGTTAPAMAFNTGAYVWLADQSKAALVAQNIMRANDRGIQSAYYLDTSGAVAHYVRAPGTVLSPGMEAANQYLLGTLMNGHQPSVVALCKADATTSPDTTQWKGDHGGVGWDSQHIPLIFSGPMIRAGTVVNDPAQLEDIATTALQAMGVRSTGMQGHVLTEVLHRSTKADRLRRTQEIKTVSPIVNALIAQNSVELAK